MKKPLRLRFPPALAVVFLIFLNAPIFAALFVENPVSLQQQGDVTRAAVVAFAYYAGPLLLAALMIARHFLTIPMFVLESLALICHSVMQAEQFDPSLQFIRYVLLAVMLVLGLLIFNKDTLYPFLGRGKRWWRRSPRLYANRSMTLRLDGEEDGVSVMLQDCSLHGLGLTGNKEAIKAMFDRKGETGRLLVGFRTVDGPAEATADVVWVRDLGGIRQVGVDVPDMAFMESLMAHVDLRASGPSALAWFDRAWARTSVRRTTLAIWAAVLSSNYVTPACGTQAKKDFRSHKSAAVSGIFANSFGEKGADRRTTSLSKDRGFGMSMPGDLGLAGGGVRDDVALAYTGRNLEFANCDGATGSLNEYVSQARLLAAFQGNQDWWGQALASLEESDRTGVRRPKTAVHHAFAKRLNVGARNTPVMWRLNLLRVRLGEQPHIKLNYELDPWAGNSHDSVAFAAVIHGIAIPPERQAELIADLNAVPQAPAASGCALKRLVDKWVFGAGSYWFAHTNVLDLERNEWVFTELKPVTNDLAPVNTGCRFTRMCGMMSDSSMDSDGDGVPDFSDMCPDRGNEGAGVDGFGCPMPRISESDMMRAMSRDSDGDGVPDVVDFCPTTGSQGFGVDGNGCPIMASFDADRFMQMQMTSTSMSMSIDPPAPPATSTATSSSTSMSMPRRGGDMRLSGGERRILGFLESKAGLKGHQNALRIVPMLFNTFTWDPKTKALKQNGADKDVTIWFSGSETDRNGGSLVEAADRGALPRDHAARTEDKTFTCAGCHARDTLGAPEFVGEGQNLGTGVHMEFRHVGFGWGRDQIFGYPRPHNRAELSPYLVDIAIKRKNGFAGKAAAAPSFYGVTADAQAATACEPSGGCRGCSYHQDFKLCLWDATQQAMAEPLGSPFRGYNFPGLREEAIRHGLACVKDAQDHHIDGSQCDFLRCVANEADLGTSLENRTFGEPFNDPTFGCEMDLKLRPNK